MNPRLPSAQMLAAMALDAAADKHLCVGLLGLVRRTHPTHMEHFHMLDPSHEELCSRVEIGFGAEHEPLHKCNSPQAAVLEP